VSGDRRRRRLPAAVRPPDRRVGEDPDVRFTLANERTFLSWIRTALALDAAGLAVIQLLPELVVPYVREALGIALVVIGTVVASASFRRWASVEDAMRTRTPLPTSWLPGFLAASIGGLSLVAAVLLIAARQ
jgi:putative membrane protein